MRALAATISRRSPPVEDVSEAMKPHICFVGLASLPVLAREFSRHGVGGEELQHTLLAKAFRRRGYRVSMIVADYGQEDGAVWDGITTYKAYRVSAGLPGIRFFHPRWSGLWSAAKRANADVYYASCASMQIGELAMYARLHGRKLIFRIAHDDDCDPRRSLSRLDSRRLHRLVHAKLYHYGVRHADAILAQSVRQQAAMRAHFGLDTTLATMLVEPASKHLGYEQRDISLLWVNNIRPFKRADLFLELCRLNPDIPAHMIGGCLARNADLYEQTRRSAEAIAHLRFHGRVPYHEVNDFYERARLFVNTSDAEGFPNSYLQAWMRGTPVVAFFDPDGLIEREGLGCTVHSLDEMRAAVRELLGDPVRWSALSERCRAYMAREYSEENILRPYIAVISQLTRQHQNALAGVRREDHT